MLHKSSNVNSQQNILWVLTLFNVLAGLWCIPLAIHIGYMTVYDVHKNFIGPDFMVYYAAARILHVNTHALYNISTYQDIYVALRPSLASIKSNISFLYLSPPPLAFLLYPLGFLSFNTAFLTFSCINIFLLFVLAVQVRKFIHLTTLQRYTFFLQSILLCLFAVFNIFAQGQISLIACVLIMGFLLDMHAGKIWRPALWLAIAIYIKPHYFIPLLLVLAGQKRWRHLIASGLIIIALALLSMLICGVDIGESYIQVLLVDQDYKTPYQSMVNLRGALEILFGKFTYEPLMANIGYIGLCVFALIGSYLRPQDNRILPAVLALSLFLSPYMRSHDMLLYFPVGLSIMLVLNPFLHKKWLLSGYFLIVFMPHITFDMGETMQTVFILCNCIISAIIVSLALYSLYFRQTQQSIPIILDSSRRNL